MRSWRQSALYRMSYKSCSSSCCLVICRCNASHMQRDTWNCTVHCASSGWWGRHSARSCDIVCNYSCSTTSSAYHKCNSHPFQLWPCHSRIGSSRTSPNIGVGHRPEVTSLLFNHTILTKSNLFCSNLMQSRHQFESNSKHMQVFVSVLESIKDEPLVINQHLHTNSVLSLTVLREWKRRQKS